VKTGERPAVSVFQLATTAALLAELQLTDVGYAKSIEDPGADLALTGPSGEHLVRTTVAFTRHIGENNSNEPINHCEIPRIRIVIAIQLGPTAVRKAVAAIVGQRYAVLAVVALRVGHVRRPIASVALRHGSAGEGGNRNYESHYDQSDRLV